MTNDGERKNRLTLEDFMRNTKLKRYIKQDKKGSKQQKKTRVKVNRAKKGKKMSQYIL